MALSIASHRDWLIEASPVTVVKASLTRNRDCAHETISGDLADTIIAAVTHLLELSG